MGEIADMMLEGFMDEETGEIIDGESPGYPRRMSDAADDSPLGRSRSQRDTRCPVCKRKFRGVIGLAQHRVATKH